MGGSPCSATRDNTPIVRRLSGQPHCAMVLTMIAWVLRTAVAVVANAVALLVAALVLSRFEINVLPFITVAVIFTLAIILIEPIADELAGRYAPGVRWLASLVTVFAGLVIANVVAGDAVSITGVWTWVWATLIVWVGTLVYALVGDRAVAAVERQARRESGGPTA